MRFYEATRFLFPRSFRLRIFTICFFCTHLPLLAFIGFQIMVGGWRWEPFFVVLGATLVGTAGALASLGALLSPVARATQALRQVQFRQPVNQLPSGGDDLVGHLLEGVNKAAEATDTLIAHLDDAAGRDLLTGLRNRRAFLEQARRRIERHPISAIAMIDIDRFKSVNDRLGHTEGDRVLREVAGLLAELTRADDLICRWGGEEFVILFPGCAPSAAAQRIEKVNEQLATMPVAMVDGRPVRFSGGVSSVPTGEVSIDRAIARADAALYEAKRSGRARVVTATD
jgi:diguanylate cyclase (GGDEF)-like protein